MKDAFGYAGTAALSNYMDLGAGVLILWVGGLLALSKPGSTGNPAGITIGRLVAFQLFWNM